jgi:ABC-type hemin transport system substrate-binding protein
MAVGLDPRFRGDDKFDQFERVVSLAPSMTDIMLYLKQGHRLVGVTTNCQNVNSVAKIGSFADPNFEAVVFMKPDLVLGIPHVMAKTTLKALSNHNIEVLAQEANSLAEIKDIIYKLSKKLNIEKQGELLIRNIDAALLRGKAEILKLELTDDRSTLIAFSATPLVIAGRKTFPGEIIENLGLVNQARDQQILWPIWPWENLLSKPPHLLLLAEGSHSLIYYQKAFQAIGLDLKKIPMRLIIPDRPIFNLPSPSLIEDIDYLIHLLRINFWSRTNIGFSHHACCKQT